MSFPQIFRKLFANEGAGPKLREDILPDSLTGIAEEVSTVRQAAENAQNSAIVGISATGTSITCTKGDGSAETVVTQTVSTSEPSGGSDGDVWIQYIA